MMMKYSRDEEILPKQEGDDAKTTTNNNNLQGSKYYKGAGASSSSSRQWSAGLKNPRIVRVSRTFGGKDRHSKVCTIRGLRDRRIRLSVPTAIQLYDLQDRLGLSQPSKVIDWLLDATKGDIDKLPPLQIPPGSFGFHHHQQQHPMAPFDHVANHHTGAFQSSFGAGPFFDADLTLMNDIATGASNPLYNSSAKQGININHGVDINVEEQEEEDEEEEEEEDNQLSLEARLEKISRNINRSNEEKHHHHDQYHGAAGGHNTYGSSTPQQQQRQRQQQQQEEAAAAALAQNLFPLSNGLSSNITPMAPYGDYHDHWEPPSNLSLYHFGSLNHLPSADPQTDHQDQTSSSTSAVPLPSSQLFFCPQANMASTSSLFPPQYSSYNINTQVDRE